MGEGSRPPHHTPVSYTHLDVYKRQTAKSSSTRAWNLYQAAGCSITRFEESLYKARSLTQESTAQIKAVGDDPNFDVRRKIKMPYFFAVLEDILGLRDAPEKPAARPRTSSKPAQLGRRKGCLLYTSGQTTRYSDRTGLSHPRELCYRLASGRGEDERGKSGLRRHRCGQPERRCRKDYDHLQSWRRPTKGRIPRPSGRSRPSRFLDHKRGSFPGSDPCQHLSGSFELSLIHI